MLDMLNYLFIRLNYSFDPHFGWKVSS